LLARGGCSFGEQTDVVGWEVERGVWSVVEWAVWMVVVA